MSRARLLRSSLAFALAGCWWMARRYLACFFGRHGRALTWYSGDELERNQTSGIATVLVERAEARCMNCGTLLQETIYEPPVMKSGLV